MKMVLPRASWTFEQESEYPGKIFNLVMDKMLIKDFDRGLEKLKKYSEEHAAEVSADAEVTMTDFSGHTYAIVRKKISWDEMHTFFAESFATIGKVAGAAIIGNAFAIYYEWNEGDKTTDVAAAMPVKDDFKAANGVAIEKLPASPAYTYVLKGNYDKMAAAHTAIGAQMQQDGAEPAWVIEEYVVNPFQEKDPEKWVTNVYYLKK